MIVPMKKIFIIVQTKDAREALQDLRLSGVLHVEPSQPPQGQDLQLLQEELGLINTSLNVYAPMGILPKENKAAAKIADWKVKARHLVELGKRYEQLQAYVRNLSLQISEWERWGDFDPQEILGLEQRGIYLRLYQVPVKELKSFPPNAAVKNIFTAAGLAHCVVISHDKLETTWKEIALPRQSLTQMKERLIEAQKTIASLKQEVQDSLSFYSEWLRVKAQLEKEIEFQQALLGMAQAEQLSYITGYLPGDAVAGLTQKAREKSWGCLMREPREEDSVPTLIRNPRWVSLISPMFKFLEILPGYHELDISPLFLIFFSLFFGMIIGDAGYGIIYILLTRWLQKKFSKKIEAKVFSLFYLLSSCAVIWGLLTGTVFGQEWYVATGLKPLIPILKDTKFLQAFCFFIGALHLTLGHAWRAMLKLPSFSALADLGWISLLWAGFFLAKTLILDAAFPFFGKWLIIAGIALVIFFTNPQRNIFKAIGQGLGAVALSLMNNFTDVVSYIRLFAVGLAGVAIADTMNSLAGAFGGNWGVRILILFLGHTLNIILGPMSVLVHGIRLNVLEFSSHANIGWSGTAYKPLKA